MNDFFVARVCAHRARPPSIRILIGSKYEIYQLKDRVYHRVGCATLCLTSNALYFVST